MIKIHSSFLDHFLFNKKEAFILKCFWLGFTIYTLSYTLSKTTYANYVVCELIQSVGIVIFLSAAISLIQLSFESNYFKFLFLIYCIWLFGIILRGVTFDYVSLKIMLFDAWFGIFVYLAPLIVLFPKRLIFYRKAFDVLAILGVSYILYDLLFLNNLLDNDLSNLTSQAIVEYATKTIALPCAFLLLTFRYHSKNLKLLGLVVIILAIFFAIVRGRRGLILMSVSPLIFVYLLYMIESKRKFLHSLISILAAFIISMYGIWAFESEIFNSVKQRGLENTRSKVEASFYKDMNITDWIIGRGINGKYYCPGIDPDSSSPYRTTIETDFLQLILKGGLINLGLLLLITIPASIIGIFFSNNMLSRAAGFWILLWLISLYPANVNTFTMNYLLVWMSVGICYSKTLRIMPEGLLMSHFQSDHKIVQNI